MIVVGTGVALARVRRETLEQVLHVVRRLGAATSLEDALEDVAEAVTDVLGFGSVAINVTQPDGDLRLDVVHGIDGTAALGDVVARSVWDDILAGSERWGDLRFYGHEADQTAILAMPELKVHRDGPLAPGAWHEDDILLAPLHDDEGALVGVISVDEPLGGRLPDQEQCTVLELFAAQAASAIVRADRRARLGDEERLYHRVFVGTPAPTLIVGSDLRVVSANDAACRILLRDAAGIEGVPLSLLVDPLDVAMLLRGCTAVLEGATAEASLEHRVRRPDEVAVRVRTSVVRITSERSGTWLVLHLRDVTEARRTIEELQHRADHDVGTGLPNRLAARQVLRATLGRSQPGEGVAVLACSLDHVGPGGARGLGPDADPVVARVAQRLARTVRPGDQICRLGDDELLVVAPLEHGRASAATGIAQRCVDAVRPRFELRDGVHQVTCCVGVVVAGSGDDPAAIVAAARVARQESARRGGDRWHLGRLGDPRAGSGS